MGRDKHDLQELEVIEMTRDSPKSFSSITKLKKIGSGSNIYFLSQVRIVRRAGKRRKLEKQGRVGKAGMV
jgi:hypothetical protein